MRAAALALLLAGCAPQVASLAPPVVPIAATQKKGSPGQRARLGWVSWSDADTLIVCNRRVDDGGNPVGVLGPCAEYRADGTRRGLVSFLNTEPPDATRADATPPALAGCTLAIEDAKLTPPAAPARLWLVAPSGKTLLDEWSPDAKVNGDAFLVEPCFSADGKRLALVRLAIGIGEGERIIEVAWARLIPTPACK